MIKLKAVYLILLAGAAVFYIFYVGDIAFLTLVFAALLPLMLFIPLLVAGAGIRAEIVNKNTAENKGSDIKLRIAIKNRSFVPVANTRLVVTVTNAFNDMSEKLSLILPIEPRSEKTAELCLSAAYCGRLTIRLSRITLYDFLNITFFTRRLRSEASAVILPCAGGFDARISCRTDSDSETDEFSATRGGDDPSEIFSLREYIEGDKLNRIHWKLSSKLSSGFIVKEFGRPVTSSVLLLTEFFADIHGERYLEIIDSLIECTYILSSFLCENGVEHGIAFYGGAGFINCGVLCMEELSDVLGGIYSCKPYVFRTLALDCFLKAEHGGRYSHVVYITPTLSPASARALSLSERCDRATVIYTGAGEPPSPEAERLRVVKAVRDDIKGSLCGIEL